MISSAAPAAMRVWVWKPAPLATAPVIPRKNPSIESQVSSPILKMELLTFELLLEKPLLRGERSILDCIEKDLHPYYIYFDALINEGITYSAVYGNGFTLDEAAFEYAKKISGKRLVFNYGAADQFAIEVPQLTHTQSI